MKPAKKHNKEFDEVEHWLNFIEEWKATHQDTPVPVKLLDLLEEALEKSLAKYRNRSLGLNYADISYYSKPYKEDVH